MKSHSLGDLQHLVMVAVARLGREAYGGAVQDELLRVAGRDISVSSAYVTLVRLEEQGLLTSRQDARGPGEVGRPRRVFELTEAGWEALRVAREALDRIWEGVEPA
ncbi:MAG: PadR family transcriptional regulator [Gemmatimonadota bacterium]|jgi:PadR family transcriptional regulator PadR